jgi:hypothetical protein
VEEVRHRRRAGPAERRRVDPYLAELAPDPSYDVRAILIPPRCALI